MSFNNFALDVKENTYYNFMYSNISSRASLSNLDVNNSENLYTFKLRQ